MWLTPDARMLPPSPPQLTQWGHTRQAQRQQQKLNRTKQTAVMMAGRRPRRQERVLPSPKAAVGPEGPGRGDEEADEEEGHLEGGDAVHLNGGWRAGVAHGGPGDRGLGCDRNMSGFRSEHWCVG